MQPISSNAYSWSLIADAKPRQLCRIKDGTEKTYIQGNFIASGATSVVYSLVSNDHIKPKVIKVSTGADFTKEYELLQKINSTGIKEGIVGAPKGLIAKKIMVMSQYSANFQSALRNSDCTEYEIVNGLQQILRGLEYLKNNNFYHGDIVATNIFIKICNGVKSFHLGDFGHGENFNEFKTEQQYYNRLLKLQMLHIVIPLALSQLHATPAEKRLDYAKSLFYSTEAFAFGLLIRDVSNELKNDSRIKESLALLGEDVMNAKSFEGLENRLEQLSSRIMKTGDSFQ